jgi:alpha-L-fucosidase
VIFSEDPPDVRWIGNEQGIAGEPNWSTVDHATVPVPGMGGDEVMRQLQHGDRDGTVWRPGETDVSIRPGWFHHPAEDDRVRSVDNLVDLYFTSVGRNSKLLLNVPPTREGVLHETDVARLAGMRARLDTIFAEDLTRGGRVDWRATGQRTAIGEVDLGREVVAGVSDLREDIARGQSVSAWVLEGETPGGWTELCRGTTIGYRKLDRFDPARVRRLRLTIEDAINSAAPVRPALFA